MASFISNLKPIFGSISKQATVPSNTNSIKSVSGIPSITKKSWVLGGFLTLFFLILLAAMAISIKQTRNNTAYLKIIARMQMQHHRLAYASEQAILGKETAFIQLRESHKQLTDFISLLNQGGQFRGNSLSPLSNDQFRAHFESYLNKWHHETNQVNLILDNQEVLTPLDRIVKEINVSSSQLLKLVEQLGNRMEPISHITNDMIPIGAMRAFMQSFTKNVNTILPGQFSIADTKEQLAQDRDQISAIIHTLNQNINELNPSSFKNNQALEAIAQIQLLFRKIDHHINIIQNTISKANTAKFAAREIRKNNEIILNITDELEQALREQDANIMHLLTLAGYASGILAILTLILFIIAVTRNTHNLLLFNKHEVEQTQKAILRLLDDMEKLADGNLTVRTAVTEDITGAIADSINYTIEELQALVKHVNQATAQVVGASSQAQRISSELLIAAQQQSEKIEETTIAVLGTTESINEVSEIAAESAKVAKQSLATAEKGAVAVHESIAGMNEIRTYIQDTSKRIKRLGESSQEIGEIIALISDITEQTNVLALNAAIQATAAGEAGRGFTVIAQEVQRLAERSAEATKQIGVLVRTIQGDTQDTITAMERSTIGVTKGAKRSDAAGQALEEIGTVSRHLAQLVSRIFDSTHTQAQAANKIVENMEEILHITRKTTNGTTQTTQSIQQISSFARELKASVSNFRV